MRELELAYVMAYQPSFSALQKSLYIRHPGSTISIANAISRHAVLLKLILEARKRAKTDWLLRAVTKM